MYHDPAMLWKEWLERGLAEDGYPWDWTTRGSLSDPSAPARAEVLAKADGVFAAAGLAQALEIVARGQGIALTVESKARNGERVKPGQVVSEWSGPAQAVLAFERVYLNLASYVSGVATATRALVDAISAAWPKSSDAQPPRVSATRKTLPGYRDLALHGVLAGGGFSHRYNLAAGILIKENHIAAAGGIARAIEGVKRSAPHGLRIEIEVRDESELKSALSCGIDGVLLDNFSPARVRECLAAIPDAVWVEVSGGISLSSIGSYAIPGVDVISSGSITHSVKGLDLSLLVKN